MHIQYSAAPVTQSAPVNFAEARDCAPTFDLKPLTRISNCLQANESCLVLLGGKAKSN